MVSLKSVLSVVTVLQVILYLDASFISSPTEKSPAQIVLKGELLLKCENQDPSDETVFDGWYKDDVLVAETKRGSYRIERKSHETTLRIQGYGANEENVEKWSVKSKGVDVCVFTSKSIEILPSPQSISTDRADERITISDESIRRLLGESIRMKCELGPVKDPSKPQSVTWLFSRTHSNFHELLDHVVINETEIFIEKIAARDRGSYRCQLNNADFTVILRAKDKYGAFWPFAGIVVVVIILVVAILCYEKLSKAKKKAKQTKKPANDQADDPLVKKSSKTDDENEQKNTVQA